MSTEQEFFDGREMTMAHRLFRRELSLAPGLLRGVTTGDVDRARDVVGHVQGVLQILHHHDTEDTLVWPKLLERAPEETTALVELMETQHQEVAKYVDEAVGTLTTFTNAATATAREDAAASIERLLPVLREHLDTEKRQVVGLMEQHITVAERNKLIQQGTAATSGAEHGRGAGTGGSGAVSPVPGAPPDGLPWLAGHARPGRPPFGHQVAERATYDLQRREQGLRLPPLPAAPVRSGLAAPERSRNRLDHRFRRAVQGRRQLGAGLREGRRQPLCSVPPAAPAAVRTLFATIDRTPAAFIREQRLVRARRLLLDRHDRAIALIAYASGFAETHTFERAFRREHGIPPARRRRNNT